MTEKSQPLKGAAPAVKNAAEKKAAPSDGLIELEVWFVPKTNRTMLVCHAVGADGSNPNVLVRVTVRDNSFFLKKMRLRARQVNDHRFDFEGACPRWRGKW
jgi:hypothetical protein